MATRLPPIPDHVADPPSPAGTVRRQPDRARYDRDAVHAVLDRGFVAHVGISVDGEPFVLPMVYARNGDTLLLHGSVASRLLRHGADELAVCVTVTHIDGLVLARSAFHHSINYRSVVIRARARRVTDVDALTSGFATLVDHVVPGRSQIARPPDPLEVRQTLLLELPIDDASVKVRTGGPLDDEADLELPVWAGVIPLSLIPGSPEPAPDLRLDDLAPPEAVTLP